MARDRAARVGFEFAMSRLFRWGILGTAEIARKNWKAICNSGNGIVAAVASRTIDRSERFIAECQKEAPYEQLPRALASYQALIEAKDVDGVYIPLPTGLRKEWVIRAANAGKHVICEKPCGVVSADVREMIDACRRNKVQFMDGVMFVHSHRLDQVRSVLEKGDAIGRMRRITSAFSFCAPKGFMTTNIRAQRSLEPQGCLGDLGWYCVRFALWAMNWAMPTEVRGRLLAQSEGEAGVPTEFSSELLFEHGVSAEFYCSFITGHQQWAMISGTAGYLRVADFVLPYFGSRLGFEVQNAVYSVRGCEFNMEPHETLHWTDEYSNSHPNAQESNLFRNFVRQVESGALNEQWPESAYKTQRVIDACLESALREKAVVLG